MVFSSWWSNSWSVISDCLSMRRISDSYTLGDEMYFLPTKISFRRLFLKFIHFYVWSVSGTLVAHKHCAVFHSSRQSPKCSELVTGISVYTCSRLRSSYNVPRQFECICWGTSWQCDALVILMKESWLQQTKIQSYPQVHESNMPSFLVCSLHVANKPWPFIYLI